MRKTGFTFWFLGCLGLAAGPGIAQPQVHGYVQTWATLYEQFENGVRQFSSGDQARQETSGFSIRRARISVQDSLEGGRVWYRVEAQLEKNGNLSDCYVAVRLAEGLDLYLGQMKVPSTYEVATPTMDLEFLDPAAISAQIVDWSLSRTPYISTFMGNRADLRDLGVGLKGRLWQGRARYFAMLGNGLGANLYIGGKQNKQYVFANGVGDLFYGLRLELQPWPWLALGAHASYNRHDNLLYNDEKSVYDLRRRSQSIDLLLRPTDRLRVRALCAWGLVDDDFYRDNKTNYEYAGWEARALYWLWPERLELGLRFDQYAYEFSESGNRPQQRTWTLGANGYWGRALKLQLDYLRKQTEEEYVQDLGDDGLLANLQLSF